MVQEKASQRGLESSEEASRSSQGALGVGGGGLTSTLLLADPLPCPQGVKGVRPSPPSRPD